MSRLRAYLPPLLWAAAVLTIGSLPDVPAPATSLPLDKVAHLLMYGVLGVLLGRAWRRAGSWPPLAIVLALGLLAGAADELHQRRVPGRSAERADWLMDALGVLGGGALGASTRRRSRPPETT